MTSPDLVKLVDANDIRPSAYNPRQADPARLELVALSLRKLGFLLPIYADPDGEILSGHQRHYVATEMLGAARLPVERTRAMDLDERKATNIVFNRGTNDSTATVTPTDMTRALEKIDLAALADAVPDKQVDSEEFYPILRAQYEPIGPYLEANAGRWSLYARNIARTLRKKGVRMPVVVTPDRRVVNGIGRLEMAAELGEDQILVVQVSEAEGALAEVMLNLLSMDFDIHRKYADILRFNSFRRARTTRSWLGYAFTFAVWGRESKQFDIFDPAMRRRWVAEHGMSVVDFGAGHFTETEILRSAGIRVSAFEPYRLIPATEKISKERSLITNRAFLKDVADGVQWSSIFLSAVMNSVPFQEDRLHISAILHALASPTTKLYAFSADEEAWRNRWRDQVHETAQRVTFVLPYEPRVSLGEFKRLPKMQKFFALEEFRSLFSPFWMQTQPVQLEQRVAVIASRPRAIDRKRLRAALEFEFNLPYPDGSRMGLVDEAVAAFERRLGCRL